MAAKFTRPYVEATAQVAGGAEALEALVAPLAEIVAAMRTNDDLRRALANPALPRDRKAALLDSLASRVGLSALGTNLLRALLGNRRIAHLGEVVTAIGERVDVERKIAEARVRSAVALDEATSASVRESLEKATGKKIRLRAEVDPSLLGGFVVQLGSSTYDASLAGRLRKARAALSSAPRTQ
ncbi:MAG: ATP synthase F1 subunit delta [Acidobacteria bacterium]|nr:ATP synthase F1 subunit delta [Acidobacteriota bacterium]